MGELLLKKVLLMRDRVARVRAALPMVPEEILKDDRLEAFLSFNLFLLVQDAVDLATHMVAARGLTIPGSQREIFDALGKEGLLSTETCRDMAQLASLRNRIAHAYGDLEPVRLVREAPQGLARIERFLTELVATITG